MATSYHLDSFIEATFNVRPGVGSDSTAAVDPAAVWYDSSTDSHFVFSSPLGYLSLRKRNGFPATFAFSEGGKLHAGYGNSQLGRSITSKPLHSLPEATFYGDEFLYIVADAVEQKVTIQRDAVSTLPLFLGTCSSDQLVIANRYERVYELVNPALLTINRHALASSLAGITNYDTLFHGIETLFDRMRATWQATSRAGQPTDFKRELAPSGSVRAIAQQRDGDGRQFFDNLESTLERYWQRYAARTTAGAELSGGMDSSAIVGYLAANGHPVLPASIIYNGTYQQSIRLRLNAFTESFGISGYEVPLDPERDFPLAGQLHGDMLRPAYLAEDIYTHTVRRMAAYLHQQGATVVFRGTGGDELFENIPAYADTATAGFEPRQQTLHSYATPELQSWVADTRQTAAQQPLPLLSQSVTTAGLSAANPYIDHDIWPVLPLVDPQLYLYCQSLPIRYRHNRNILRAYMHARRFPAVIYDPQVRNEHFGDFFNTAVPAALSTVFANYMQSSVLADMGLIDSQQALQLWRQAKTDQSDSSFYQLFCLLRVEAALKLWRSQQFTSST